jgi:hypothetical protein
MKFKLVALLLTAVLSGCGGSASSEVEHGALPDLRYQLALELYLRDSVVTGNTILSYGGELELRRNGTRLALSGTDSLRLRDPLNNNDLAYISNIILTSRCCGVASAAPVSVMDQLVQRPELLFVRASNIDDRFLAELPPALLLVQGTALSAEAFGYKTVGNGTLQFQWTADGYPTEVVVEQLGAACPAGENAVRLVRTTQHNTVFIDQTALGRCNSKQLLVSFNRSKIQNYRTAIQSAEVTGTVTVKRQLTLSVP